MDGIVKAISEKNKSVLVESDNKEKWYKLAEHVKIGFVKKGNVDFRTAEDDDNTIVWIKPLAE